MITSVAPAYNIPSTGIGMAFHLADLRYMVEIQRSTDGANWFKANVVVPSTAYGMPYYDPAPLDGVARYYRARTIDGAGRVGPWLQCTPTTGKPKQLRSTPLGDPFGTVLRAADLSRVIGQGQTDVNSRYRVSLSQSAAQSVANNTDTALQFDTELYDASNLHDNVTNNSRITIPSVNYLGIWLFWAQADFASNATGARRLYFAKNGSAVSPQTTRTAVAGGGTDEVFNHMGFTVDPAPGDYFEAFVKQTSGGALNVQGFFGCVHIW